MSDSQNPRQRPGPNSGLDELVQRIRAFSDHVTDAHQPDSYKPAPHEPDARQPESRQPYPASSYPDPIYPRINGASPTSNGTTSRDHQRQGDLSPRYESYEDVRISPPPPNAQPPQLLHQNQTNYASPYQPQSIPAQPIPAQSYPSPQYRPDPISQHPDSRQEFRQDPRQDSRQTLTDRASLNGPRHDAMPGSISGSMTGSTSGTISGSVSSPAIASTPPSVNGYTNGSGAHPMGSEHPTYRAPGSRTPAPASSSYSSPFNPAPPVSAPQPSQTPNSPNSFDTNSYSEPDMVPFSPAAPSDSIASAAPNVADIPKTGLQRAVDVVRSALPLVQRLLPLLDGTFTEAVNALVAPHPAQPTIQQVQVDLEPIERGLTEVRNSHRELRTQVLEQITTFKRVEDQLERVREATDRNTLEQQELVEDVRSVGSRLSTFAIIGLVLLILSVAINAFFLVQLQHLLR